MKSDSLSETIRSFENFSLTIENDFIIFEENLKDSDSYEHVKKNLKSFSLLMSRLMIRASDLKFCKTLETGMALVNLVLEELETYKYQFYKIKDRIPWFRIEIIKLMYEIINKGFPERIPARCIPVYHQRDMLIEENQNLKKINESQKEELVKLEKELNMYKDMSEDLFNKTVEVQNKEIKSKLSGKSSMNENRVANLMSEMEDRFNLSVNEGKDPDKVMGGLKAQIMKNKNLTDKEKEIIAERMSEFIESAYI